MKRFILGIALALTLIQASFTPARGEGVAAIDPNVVACGSQLSIGVQTEGVQAEKEDPVC